MHWMVCGRFSQEKWHFCVIYFDDLILIAKTFRQCIRNRDFVIDTLEKCGFIISYKKSVLTPSKTCEVMGFKLNSASQTISLTETKRVSLLKIFKTALTLTTIKIRHMARLIGLAVAMFPCFPHGKMYYRELEHSKLKALKMRRYKWNKTMTISNTDREALKWWYSTFKKNNPHHFDTHPIEGYLETDSSLQGWGYHLLSQNCSSVDSTGSCFGHADTHHPINNKELLAIKYGISTYKQFMANKHFVLKSDSVTALHDL